MPFMSVITEYIKFSFGAAISLRPSAYLCVLCV